MTKQPKMLARIKRLISTRVEQGRDVEGLAAEVRALRQKVSELQATVAALQSDVQQGRRLHRRLAEITDVVEELLVPIAQQDTEKVRAVVARYADLL